MNNLSAVQTSEQELDTLFDNNGMNLSSDGVKDLISLRDSTYYIKRNINDIRSCYFSIGKYLNEIKDCSIYQILGFADFYDYCEKTFGFKKTFTCNLISVSKKFKSDEFEGSSISALIELLPVSDNKDICIALKNSTVKEIREAKEVINSVDSAISELLMTKYNEFVKELDPSKNISYFNLSTSGWIRVSFRFVYKALWIKKPIVFNCGIYLDDGSFSYRLSCDYTCENICNKLSYKGKTISSLVDEQLSHSYKSIARAVEAFKKVKIALDNSDNSEVVSSTVKEKDVPKTPKSSRGLTNDKKRDEYLHVEDNWELVNEFEDIIVRKLTVKKTYYVVYFKGNFKLDLIFYKYESYYDGKILISYLNSASTIVSEMKEVGY